MKRREFIALVGGAAAARAARCARATAGQATDNRIPWRRRRRLASLDGRLCGATARTGLDRRSNNRNRLSLDGGTSRAIDAVPTASTTSGVVLSNSFAYVRERPGSPCPLAIKS